MTRRSLFSGLAGAAAVAAQPQTETTLLKSFGRPCGRMIGIQTEKSRVADRAVAHFVKSNFDIITPGNELKWMRVQPNQGQFNFSDGDWMVSFAKSNGLAVHGHNLCWNANNPAWLNKAINRENARQLLETHITTVMKHYAGQIDSWDVVNEPILPSGNAQNNTDNFYHGPWLNTLGIEYIDIAFNAALAADPKPLRIMNLHHVEQDEYPDDRGRQTALKLIKGLLDRKVPIQAVGFESHLNASLPVKSEQRNRFIKQIKDWGLQFLITELDVNDAGVEGDVAHRDATVAKYYYDYLMDVLPLAHSERVILWTETDKNNWLTYIGAPQFQRKDGRPVRPGLIDEQMNIKPSYLEVRRALSKTCS